MYARTSITLNYTGLFLVLLVPLCNAENADPGTVVGSVAGTDIRYADVRVTLESALARYRLTYGHEASTDAEMLEVEQIRLEREASALAARMREIIHGQQVSRFALEVSDREVRERWDELTSGVDLEKAAERQRQMIEPLLAALKAVYEGGEDEAKVYQERLRESVTAREWAVHLSYYRTPQRRAILEQATNMTAKDWEHPIEGVRALLLEEKLNKAIEREIARTDPGFAQYIRLAKTDPLSEKVQGKGPNYTTRKRHQWWQQRYREANVEIKIERFKDVWKEPFE